MTPVEIESVDEISNKLSKRYRLKTKKKAPDDLVHSKYQLKLENALIKAINKGNVDRANSHDFFSVQVMSRYINHLLTSTNDDFIKRRHESYRKRNIKRLESRLRSSVSEENS